MYGYMHRRTPPYTCTCWRAAHARACACEFTRDDASITLRVCAHADSSSSSSVSWRCTVAKYPRMYLCTRVRIHRCYSLLGMRLFATKRYERRRRNVFSFKRRGPVQQTDMREDERERGREKPEKSARERERESETERGGRGARR
jgi:hypothetical protein